MTEGATTLLAQLIAAIEARPEEARSFGIPPFNGGERVVIHRGLPGGHITTSIGFIDELIQAGMLTRTRGQLHELTDAAHEWQRAATIPARVTAAGRETWKVIVAAAAVVAAIIAVLTWLGVRP